MGVQLPIPSRLARLLLTILFAVVLPSPIKAADVTDVPAGKVVIFRTGLGYFGKIFSVGCPLVTEPRARKS